jgi:hypothetical protein
MTILSLLISDACYIKKKEKWDKNYHTLVYFSHSLLVTKELNLVTHFNHNVYFFRD